MKGFLNYLEDASISLSSSYNFDLADFREYDRGPLGERVGPLGIQF